MYSSMHSIRAHDRTANTIAIACAMSRTIGPKTPGAGGKSTSNKHITSASHHWRMAGGDSPNFRYGATSHSRLLIQDRHVYVTAGRRVHALSARTGNTVVETQSTQFRRKRQIAQATLNFPTSGA